MRKTFTAYQVLTIALSLLLVTTEVQAGWLFGSSSPSRTQRAVRKERIANGDTRLVVEKSSHKKNQQAAKPKERRPDSPDPPGLPQKSRRGRSTTERTAVGARRKQESIIDSENFNRGTRMDEDESDEDRPVMASRTHRKKMNWNGDEVEVETVVGEGKHNVIHWEADENGRIHNVLRQRARGSPKGLSRIAESDDESEGETIRPPVRHPKAFVDSGSRNDFESSVRTKKPPPSRKASTVDSRREDEESTRRSKTSRTDLDADRETTRERKQPAPVRLSRSGKVLDQSTANKWIRAEFFSHLNRFILSDRTELGDQQVDDYMKNNDVLEWPRTGSLSMKSVINRYIIAHGVDRSAVYETIATGNGQRREVLEWKSPHVKTMLRAVYAEIRGSVGVFLGVKVRGDNLGPSEKAAEKYLMGLRDVAKVRGNNDWGDVNFMRPSSSPSKAKIWKTNSAPTQKNLARLMGTPAPKGISEKLWQQVMDAAAEDGSIFTATKFKGKNNGGRTRSDRGRRRR